MNGMKKTLLHYANITWICIITTWFGGQLLYNSRNVISRIPLLEQDFDLLVGVVMVFFSVLKIISLRKQWRYIKKWSLIMILLCWICITWAYINSSLMNTSFIISIGMVGSNSIAYGNTFGRWLYR